MLCGKNEKNHIKKIHNRTPRLIYEMEDAIFGALLGRDKSRSIHENNTLISNRNLQINISQRRMRIFFDVKVNRCNLNSNDQSKLPATNTCRYYTQHCVKGSLL